MKKILITSALPYANGALHFGHIAGAYLPGDCYARFQRLMGNDVRYFCGSDEYGVAITLSAEQVGVTPQEHVDKYHNINKNLFDVMNFSFDHYSRTTCDFHATPVRQFFLELYENGYIEEHVTDHLYSEEDDKFLADRYVVGTCPKCGFDSARGDECQKCGAAYDAIDLKQPRSKLTGATLIAKPTKHWFLMLDKFKDRLEQWIAEKKWKPNVVNFIKKYIEDIRPRAITRDSYWGLPVPLENADGKVLYVWFDAPIGYISAAMEWSALQGKPDLWKDYWLDQDTKLVQFIGKDNIPFHAVIFPAMLMGQNMPYKMVDELPANEFYNLEGRRFSKSDNWYIDLDDFFTKYSSDQIRYAIAATAPETSDSEFCWKDFQVRCNSELVGKFGNFVNRTMVFAQKRCDGRIPAKEELKAIDIDFLHKINLLAEEASNLYEAFSLRKVTQVIVEMAQEGNVYFNSKQPWEDAKDPAKSSVLNTTIACCFECVKLLALISAPIVPDAVQKIWSMLGLQGLLVKKSWAEIVEQDLPAGQIIGEPKILFNKIDDDQIQLEIDALHRSCETG